MNIENFRKQILSKHLIAWAWFLEIIFVILGLLVAISFALTAYESFDDKDIISPNEWNLIILGSSVWVAVAFTELLKIPVTRGLVLTGNKLVKLLAFIFLVAICLITFESISTGIERSITMRENIVEKSRNKIYQVQNEIVLLESQIAGINVTDENTIKEKDKNSLNLQLSKFNQQIDEYKELIIELKSPNESLMISKLENELRILREKESNLTANIIKNKSDVNEQIKAVNNFEIEELQNAFIWEREGIKEKFMQQRLALKKEEENFYDNTQAQIISNSKSILSIKDQLDKQRSLTPQQLKRIDSYTLVIERLMNSKSELLKQSEKRVAEKISNQDSNQEKRKELELERLNKITQINQHRSDINKNGQDFIYSIAKRVFSVDEVADLKKEQINFIALIMISSLALIVSISGPLLTLIAVSNQIETTNKKRISISRYLKLCLVGLFRRLRSPRMVIKHVEKEVEVIKEVPVEKIVKEMVEIPKPVEITRYVGIPVPKNNEELPTLEEAISTPKINNENTTKLN